VRRIALEQLIELLLLLAIGQSGAFNHLSFVQIVDCQKLCLRWSQRINNRQRGRIRLSGRDGSNGWRGSL
jgi:hypothetical protein